jgi:hypothetical protein
MEDIEIKKDYEKNLESFAEWLVKTQNEITLILSRLALGEEEEIPSEPSLSLFKLYKHQTSE